MGTLIRTGDMDITDFPTDSFRFLHQFGGHFRML